MVHVVGFRSIDESVQYFIIEANDRSYITESKIFFESPFPAIKMKGEGILYHFSDKVPVKEV